MSEIPLQALVERAIRRHAAAETRPLSRNTRTNCRF